MGSTYLAIAIMIETLPPLLTAGIRFMAAGTLLLGFVVIRDGLKATFVPRNQWRNTVMVGVLLLLGGNSGLVLAEQYIPTGVAALLIATVPMWVVGIDAFLRRRRPDNVRLLSVMVGTAGVAVLLFPETGITHLNQFGVVLCLGAAFCWASGSMLAGEVQLPRSPMLTTAHEMLSGGVVVFLSGILLGELQRIEPATFSLRSLGALGYLVIFGSIVGFSTYTWLISNVPVSTVATHTYVNPLVAVPLGSLLLAEPLSIRVLLATILIVAAAATAVSMRADSSRAQVT